MQIATGTTTSERDDDIPLDAHIEGTDDSADKPRARIEAVERALALLQCFRQPGEILTLAVLAQRSGFYKSTILRMAASLVYMGFLQRDPRGRYLLGPELRRLGALSPAQVNLEDLVRPELHKLSSFTRETASFYVRDGKDRICLYRVNSSRSARHHLDEGSRHPLKSGAAGKVLWAFDPSATDEASATIRTRGWVVSKGERDPDLAAIAVPLLNEGGELLGALTVSGLLTRFTTDEIKTYRKRLLDVAAALKPRLPPRNVLDAV
ncbi:IclR family transcriptional regulator [Caballeronia sp. INDeC2]|uniref:IclR family transcriptional regulator n=1 Tax=Caballeronia sp. INDeC2 TaxID=2921747 RepID=UPI0020289005|nr:IclR family transcriptional regulator [Caballeronia sp. INDeC2]